jgi:hypothetical protein
MGTLTLRELEDEVRIGLGGRTDQDGRLARSLNIAQQRLARKHDFDEMEEISLGLSQNTGDPCDRYLQLPNVREVYSLVLLDDANSRKLVQVSARRFDQLIPKAEYWVRGRPSHYIIWNNTVEIWKLPDSTVGYPLRMRWTKWPADLNSPTQKSEFKNKDDLLVELTLVYIFNSIGKETEAAKHTAIAGQLYLEALTADSTKPDLDYQAGGTAQALNILLPAESNPFVRSAS